MAKTTALSRHDDRCAEHHTADLKDNMAELKDELNRFQQSESETQKTEMKFVPHTPTRRCIVSGEEKQPENMIRFVVSPDQMLVADIRCKLPGRGMWVTADRTCLQTAVEKSLFAKAARNKVDVPENIAEIIRDQLYRRCLDMVGMAQRAGQIVYGLEKVNDAVGRGCAGILLHASDGGENSRKELRKLQRKLAGSDAEMNSASLKNNDPVISAFTGQEIAAALGRDGVIVHAFVLKGGLASKLSAETKRLQGFLS